MSIQVQLNQQVAITSLYPIVDSVFYGYKVIEISRSGHRITIQHQNNPSVIKVFDHHGVQTTKFPAYKLVTDVDAMLKRDRKRQQMSKLISELDDIAIPHINKRWDKLSVINSLKNYRQQIDNLIQQAEQFED